MQDQKIYNFTADKLGNKIKLKGKMRTCATSESHPVKVKLHRAAEGECFASHIPLLSSFRKPSKRGFPQDTERRQLRCFIKKTMASLR